MRRTSVKRTAIIALLSVALYSLLGFLVLPGIALHLINGQLERYVSAPAKLQRIEFNPFSLELSLFDLRIGEPEDEQLGLDRLYLNLQWSSLWQRRLHLADVELERPRSEVRFAKDGTFNLAQLFDIPESNAPADDDAQTFPLRIDRLQLIRGYLHIQDLQPQQPVDLVYDTLNLELHNLVTRDDGRADISLVARNPAGGQLRWQGQLALDPFISNGSLSLSDLELRTFWPYVQQSVPLALKEGRLNASSDYALDLSDGFSLRLDNARLDSTALAIDSPAGEPLLRLKSLSVGDTSMSLADQRLTVGQLRLHGLETWAIREADGVLDWQKRFAGNGDATASGKQEPGQTARPWQVLLRDAGLEGATVHLTDRVPDDEVTLDLTPLDIHLRDFDSAGTTPFSLSVNAGVGRQGTLGAEGSMQLEPLSGQLAVALDSLDMRIAQAYLSPFVRLELRSGRLDGELEIALQGAEPLTLSVTGRAGISQLHALDTLNNRDFLKWQRLDVEGLDYRHGAQLGIERVVLDEPYARFIINQNLTTNINDLLIEQPEAPKRGSESAPSEPLAIRIGQVDITQGSANFADFSLRPPFATAVQELNGRIGTLDSRADRPASVEVNGKVDRYAPVTISGSLTPFDPLQNLDIATRFRQVELTTLTPYSSKFAGYRIRRGRLDLDLHYRIQQGQLRAENKVVLEQLQLGERVDSPDAVDLPVRLAVALLKDSRGTISLELPVQGDLNDPQFDVMPIVWQTLRNLVVRAAKAPFRFLGGLVGSDQDDLSHIAFAAGDSSLDAQARQALDTLAAALKERPALHLEVEGMSARQNDGPLLAEQWLEREYRSTLYNMRQRRSDQVPRDPSQLEVADGDKPALLEAIYRSRLQQQPPEPWRQLDEDERARQLRQAILDSWSDNAGLLRRLAQARAAAIKEHLVDRGGLDASRVYLLDTGLTEPDNGQVISLLHLGSD
ncbi:DUF748 domain-containing protein [Stutzerimonas azotifigens]|uniref:DUF748 domain-containing protein n=1 Tax=Stutzerimonas azotifigens TaxID=291995 RepID=A0ABR5Z533_9GAMM|nr:DUF748 domain-containing protein [Stutzerimonas azotifigens]MBA1275268.1 DUF748 domain-containing protein [Stutzerimonas azotifigens]